jgi:aldehyde dehydrogenase (NAD+)
MAGKSFLYAPAPESRAVVDLKPAYGLFIDGDFVDSLDGRPFKTISPATEEVLAEVTEAGSRDVDRAVQAARTAYDKTWSRLPAKERGKYLFRIARLIQERARELAVLETLDNGKPIRESRDVDIPLVAGALLLLRRLGRQARARRPGRRSPAARRRRADHPVELPAAHARVEGRARAGVRQHRRPQAGGDDAADRAAVRRDLPAGRPAPGRGQHPHRGRRHRTGARRAPRRRQDRVHGLDGGRQGDRPRGGRHAQEGHLELGGKAANIVFDDAPIDQAVEGIVNGIFFNQGHVCCAGSRLLVRSRCSTSCSTR